jgi:protoheme IX farnesyltransferase
MPGPVSTPNVSETRSFRRTFLAYLSLTKPRVVELLLVVTAPTMILAQQGIPAYGWCSRP